MIEVKLTESGRRFQRLIDLCYQ